MVVLLIVGLAAMFSAWSDVRQAIAGARRGSLADSPLRVWHYIRRYQFTFRDAEPRVQNSRSPLFLLWQVGYVSTLLGRNVVGGGTAGMMLCMAVLKRRAIPLPRGATVSLVQSYVNLLIAMSMFLAAVAYVVFSGSLGSVHGGALIGTIAALSIFAAAAAAALFARRFRGRLIDWLVAIVKRWTGKDLEEFGTQFAESVDEGIGALRGDIGRIAAIAVMLAIEAGMTLLARFGSASNRSGSRRASACCLPDTASAWPWAWSPCFPVDWECKRVRWRAFTPFWACLSARLWP